MPGPTSTASCAGAPNGADWWSSSGWRWPTPRSCLADWSAAPGPTTAGRAAPAAVHDAYWRSLLAVAAGNAEEDLQVLGRAAGGEDLFGRFQPAQGHHRQGWGGGVVEVDYLAEASRLRPNQRRPRSSRASSWTRGRSRVWPHRPGPGGQGEVRAAGLGPLGRQLLRWRSAPTEPSDLQHRMPCRGWGRLAGFDRHHRTALGVGWSRRAPGRG